MEKLVENTAARRFFLAKQGLSADPSRRLDKADLYKLIHSLGFVQVDSIGTVERAHHQILFSRNQTYRREDLTALIEKDRLLFENWTHDASILPSDFYPYWKRRFAREHEHLSQRWTKWHGEGFETELQTVLRRIDEGGAVMSRDMKAPDHQSGGWWNWHPSKQALEYLWRTGKIAVSGRVNFQKIYDLTERVFHAHHHEPEVSDEAFIDWACREALNRLGFATAKEIADFWAIVSAVEARDWIVRNRDELIELEIETLGTKDRRLSYAFADMAENIEAAPAPPSRIRVLSPFDPMLRDRARAERLFGFYYRIEVFVPEPLRQYGYYVFPLLEGDRLIGRIDMKAERKGATLDVRKLWLEKGVKLSAGRMGKLDAELTRLARFTGVERVNYLSGWRDECGQ
jgi:uncharacterized protein YcaQ